QYLRRVHVGGVQQRRHVDEGAAILHRRRRVHRDQRRRVRGQRVRLVQRRAEVAAKAGIGGRRRKREPIRRQDLREPIGERGEAGIGGGRAHQGNAAALSLRVGFSPTNDPAR